MKKIILFIILTIILSQSQAFSQWENLLNKRYFPELKRVSFIKIDPSNQNNILICCFSQLFYSTDNGDTWEEIWNPFLPDWEPIQMIGAYKNYFYVALNEDEFYYSSNYGKNWERCARPYFLYKFEGDDPDTLFNTYYHDMTFRKDTVYLGGNGGIFVSTNFGKSWKPMFGPDYPIPHAPGPTSVYSIIVEDNAVYIGSRKGVQVTKNHGKTWEFLNKPDNIQSLSFFKIFSLISIDSVFFALCEDDGNIYSSTNEGASWKKVYNRDDGLLFHQNIYSCGNIVFYPRFEEKVTYSKDYGKTWQELPGFYNPGDMVSFNINENYAYVGHNGTGLWRAPLSDCEVVLTDVEQKDNNRIKKLFPNPATDRIYLELNTESWQLSTGEMEIYNTFGEKMSNVSANILGEKIAVDVSGLSPGMYFLSYNTKEGKFVEKFIVIK